MLGAFPEWPIQQATCAPPMDCLLVAQHRGLGAGSGRLTPSPILLASGASCAKEEPGGGARSGIAVSVGPNEFISLSTLKEPTSEPGVL